MFYCQQQYTGIYYRKVAYICNIGDLKFLTKRARYVMKEFFMNQWRKSILLRYLTVWSTPQLLL